MRRLLPLILLLAACSKDYDSDYDVSVARPAYTSSSHPRVLVDAAHHNRHTIANTYKPFAKLLENDGYEVDTLDDTVTAAALDDAPVFVIPSAMGTDDTSAAAAFTPAEIDAIDEWVRGGGSLLLITDHYPFGTAVRDLARRFGVTMSEGMTLDPVHHDRESRDDSQLVFSRENGLLGDHAILTNVRKVVTFTGQSLRAEQAVTLLKLSETAVNRAAIPRIERDGSTVRVNVEHGPSTSAQGWAQAVAIEPGKGRVVILGEAAMISAQRDGNRRFGMNLPGCDNRQFTLNTMHWLTRVR